MAKTFKTKIPLTRPALPGDFKIKRQITLPIWRWEEGVPKYFRIDGKMCQGRVIESRSAEAKKKMEPATVAPVTNLENGMQCQIIVGTMLQNVLEESFPKDSYVGKSFAATMSKGPRYNSYSLAELE